MKNLVTYLVKMEKTILLVQTTTKNHNKSQTLISPTHN